MLTRRFYILGDVLHFQSAYRARNFCWLYNKTLYYSFLLPIGILAIFNIASMISIMVKVTCKREKVSVNIEL